MDTTQRDSDYPKLDAKMVINSDASGTNAVLNPVSGRVYIINEVGRRVLELCDGQRTTDDIVAKVASEFAGAEEASVKDDIADFVEGCVNASILGNSNPGAQ